MILESTDLSTLDLQGTFQVLLCSYVFVYCCGVVISSVFPLSYKSSVFVQYHAPLFREKGFRWIPPSWIASTTATNCSPIAPSSPMESRRAI